MLGGTAATPVGEGQHALPGHKETLGLQSAGTAPAGQVHHRPRIHASAGAQWCEIAK